MTIRTAVLEPEITAFDVAHVKQSSPQGLNCRIARASTNRQPANSRDMRSRLPQGKQRYKEEP